jgi:hypothetical protein
MATITQSQFDAGLRRLERAATKAGAADAKTVLADDPELAVQYDPEYMKSSMSLEEVTSLGKHGTALEERIDRMRSYADDNGVEFAYEVLVYPYAWEGRRQMEPWAVVRHYAKVAYVDAYDETIRASGLVPDYLRDD